MIEKFKNLFDKYLRDIFFFGVVGTVGFVVDVAVLYAVSGWLGLFYGRVVSFVAAVVATWLLNRMLTFKNRSSGLKKTHEFYVYFGLMLLGGSVNYAAYAWLVASYAVVQELPVIAVAVGSVCGMFVNFFGSRFILFKK